MSNVPTGSGSGTGKMHNDVPDEWSPPLTADGRIDWSSMPAPQDTGFKSPPSWIEEDRQHSVTITENLRRAAEADLEKAKLKAGVPIPPRPTDPSNIVLEFAMSTDTATVRLEYLVDPYLPAKCVVGFYGRGSTSKSTFLATIAAYISHWASTLWVSVEEPDDWIKVRHISSGGAEKTLAVVTAVATKADAQGRIIGSTFNIYEHLEPAILKAQAATAEQYSPIRALRLVVLDTAVALTTWAKGENANDDGGVKRLLAFLQALAEKYDLTIAIIGHANKGKHDHIADVVMGATAWTNSPRLSFIHARDRREEFAYVIRVAKTNFDTFGSTYTTTPVHTLYERQDGPDTVLCRVMPGPIIWGDSESMDMWEEATAKPQDGDEAFAPISTLVEKAICALVETVMATPPEEAVTREDVERQLGQTVNRREWKKVDNHMQGHPTVAIESGPQNKRLYRRKT